MSFCRMLVFVLTGLVCSSNAFDIIQRAVKRFPVPAISNIMPQAISSVLKNNQQNNMNQRIDVRNKFPDTGRYQQNDRDMYQQFDTRNRFPDTGRYPQYDLGPAPHFHEPPMPNIMQQANQGNRPAPNFQEPPMPNIMQQATSPVMKNNQENRPAQNFQEPPMPNIMPQATSSVMKNNQGNNKNQELDMRNKFPNNGSPPQNIIGAVTNFQEPPMPNIIPQATSPVMKSTQASSVKKRIDFQNKLTDTSIYIQNAIGAVASLPAPSLPNIVPKAISSAIKKNQELITNSVHKKIDIRNKLPDTVSFLQNNIGAVTNYTTSSIPNIMPQALTSVIKKNHELITNTIDIASLTSLPESFQALKRSFHSDRACKCSASICSCCVNIYNTTVTGCLDLKVSAQCNKTELALVLKMYSLTRTYVISDDLTPCLSFPVVVGLPFTACLEPTKIVLDPIFKVCFRISVSFVGFSLGRINLYCFLYSNGRLLWSLF